MENQTWDCRAKGCLQAEKPAHRSRRSRFDFGLLLEKVGKEQRWNVNSMFVQILFQVCSNLDFDHTLFLFSHRSSLPVTILLWLQRDHRGQNHFVQTLFKHCLSWNLVKKSKIAIFVICSYFVYYQGCLQTLFNYCSDSNLVHIFFILEGGHKRAHKKKAKNLTK